jgi:hypothetical protein
MSPDETVRAASPLLERLAQGPVLCAEGYLFECERRGYLQAGAYVPEVVLEHPEVVEELHREFVHAGSDVVEAFTYYAHREKLRLIGRAYVTIREGWDMLGAPAQLRESAEAMDLILAGGMPVHLYDDEMRAILLEAAKVISQIEAAMKAKSAEGPAADGR